MRGEGFRSVAEFTVRAGERVPFTLTWYASYQPEPLAPNPEAAIRHTEAWWRNWSVRCTYEDECQEAVTCSRREVSKRARCLVRARRERRPARLGKIERKPASLAASLAMRVC